jgi:hypothetical protein
VHVGGKTRVLRFKNCWNVPQRIVLTWPADDRRATRKPADRAGRIMGANRTRIRRIPTNAIPRFWRWIIRGRFEDRGDDDGTSDEIDRLWLQEQRRRRLHFRGCDNKKRLTVNERELAGKKRLLGFRRWWYKIWSRLKRKKAKREKRDRISQKNFKSSF